MATRDITVRDMLHRAADWFPERESVVDGLYRYTYPQLRDQVQRCAALYHSLGVRKGDRVALMAVASVQHVVALFGAIEIGAIPVALHVRESVGTLSAVLDQLSPRALVYDGVFTALVAQIRQRNPLITGFVRVVSPQTPPTERDSGDDPILPRDLAGYSLDFEPMELHEYDTAIIALSSGTTGLPKGVIHTNRTLMESARGGAYLWRMSPQDAMCNMLSTAFIGWYNVTLPVINAGAKVAFMTHWDPSEFLRTVQDERCTHAFLAPTMWRMLLRQGLGDYDLSSITSAGFAGEPMDTATLREIRERISPNILNIYGSTESGSCSAGTVMFPHDLEDESRIDSVGRPMLNADIRIIKPGGTADDVLPPGEEGEVLIRGPSVAAGIWYRPALARKVFEGPWWHSGDIGVIDQDRYLYLRGRVDDMIISGGINILPSVVEDAVMSHAAVSEAAVIGVPDQNWGQRVVAVVVKRGEVTLEELEAYVKQTDLASYARPREYCFVDELPKGNTGKVSRKTLREQMAKPT
ncbi:MAG: class I adenylate-forming enzyme family protein [Immundisolibacter sp.]|uniref:class I adenylate-forming enzyme family protein n=1 Tax=Immundisolibacter sp. TaxID=1934948 RepID=UPI003EE307F9